MKSKRPRIKTQLIVAYAAIFISLATLFVYIYQARIMQEQQHAAVWPYLEWLPSWGDHGYLIQVENKGVGPALVKNVSIKLDGKEVENMDQMFSILMDSAFTDYGYSTVKGRVIAPGEVVMALIIDKAIANGIREKLKEHKFQYEICYCSVFNDCWVSSGTTITESSCN